MKNIRILLLALIISIIYIGISCSNDTNNKKYNNLRTKIENGLDEDQKVRQLVYQNMQKDTFDIKLNKKMGEIDSMNLITAKAFLSNYGYPIISRDGKKLCDGIFNILQHNELKTMEKYIDELKERAFEGEASKKHYALMKDRILVENNLKQIYGTQSSPRRNAEGYLTNDYYIWPIENVEIVDSLRKEIGFTTSIEEYAKALDAEFNINEPLIVKK